MLVCVLTKQAQHTQQVINITIPPRVTSLTIIQLCICTLLQMWVESCISLRTLLCGPLPAHKESQLSLCLAPTTQSKLYKVLIQKKLLFVLYIIFFFILFDVDVLLISYSGDVMTIATNVTVAASSSLNLVGQITVQAAVNILKCSSSPFLSLPLSFFPPAPHSSLQSFFDHVASVQGSTTFGQSTATSAAVGATVTGSTVVNNGGSLVFYGTNYITGSVVLYASSLLVLSPSFVFLFSCLFIYLFFYFFTYLFFYILIYLFIF